ncbi:DM9 repeat-containing protein [Ramlibacter sp. AN1133]|uniref:DM9 repeat-containing protein n=1 Tax=Ramlibacter sp. AN1133 TaxID=3133429 RepID=UPI0030C047CD
MRLTGKALIGILVLGATGLACADGLKWEPKATRATLVPAGVVGGQALNVCRATIGTLVAVGEFGSDRSGECRVAVAGQQQSVLEFEVLAQALKPDVGFSWVPGHATGYPMGSVIGGVAGDGRRTLVCAAVQTSDGTVHPGFIADDNCVYTADGVARMSENYLVLVSDDPDVTTSAEAQPAMEGFDPGAILAIGGVTSLCGLAEGICAQPLPR